MSKLPIIILHGWGSNSAAWQVTKQLLQKAGYTVFIPDLPGFGQEPPPKNAWSVSDYVDFVLQFTRKIIPEGADTVPPLRCEPKQKFVLIGHSFGGRIAIKLAAQYPQKVSKLVLTGAAGIRFVSLSEKIKVKSFEMLGHLGQLSGLSFLGKKMVPILTGNRDYYLLSSKEMKETFKKVINEDLIDVLEKIKVPVCLLWGKDDLMIPPKHAYLMAKKIPGAKLEIMEKAGHRLPYGHPEIFVEKVVKFLK